MPNNWKTYKLGEITKWSSGGTPPKMSPEYWGGEIPWISAKSLKGRYVYNSDLNVTDAGLKKGSKLALKGSILLLVRGSGLYNDIPVAMATKDVSYNQDVKCVLPKIKELSNVFLLYWFKGNKVTLSNILEATSIGAGKFDMSRLLDLEFSLPSLHEQQSIASILTVIDDKIENNLAINKTLEEMAMALYKHWFVDFGPFQDGEFVESELGLIPKGWEVKKIGDVVSVIGGYAFKSKWFQENGIKVLKIKNINNNVVDISNCDCISDEVSKSINSKFKVNVGDFLVAMTGAEVGKVGVVPNYSQDLWLNQRVGKFNDKEIKNASILIGKIMQTNDFYKIIQGLAYGSAQPNISTSDIENINIILPNDKNILNTLINDFVHLHNITIENLTENQTLTELRDTLLPQLISGEVRLKEFRE